MTYKKGILTTGVAMASMLSISAYAEGPKLDVTGVVEVEFGHSSDTADDETVKGSDVTLATVELGFDVTVNENVTAHILLLHEEDETPLEVDEGIITVGDENALSFSFGQMYVPFGVFESNVVSDPLTLEMGETRESAMLVNYKTGNISAAFYLFNGTILETGETEDKLDQKGFSVRYATDNFDVGLDYISSLADADSIQDALYDDDPLVLDYKKVDGYVAGLAVHAIYRQDNFNIIFEHVKAQDAFAATDFDPLGTEKQPSATNIDVGYSMGEHNFGISIQSTKDAGGFQPEKKFLLAYSRAIYENTTMSFEYSKFDDYSISEDGTGGDGTAITAQIAVEF